MPKQTDAALPSARDLVTNAWHDRRRIGGVMAGVLALCLAAGLLLPAKYKASASLVVLLGPEYTVRTEAGAPNSASGTLESDQIMKAEVEILSGDALHEAVIRKVGLQRLYPRYLKAPGLLAPLRRWITGEAASADPVSRAVSEFDRNVDVEASKDANVITVSFHHRDATLAAETTNTLVSLYEGLRHKIYVDPQTSMVGGEVTRLDRLLTQADLAVGRFRRSHDIANFEVQRDLLLHRRADLAANLQDANGAATETQRRLTVLDAELTHTPASVPQYSEHDPDQRTSTLSAALQELRGREAQLQTRLLPTSRLLTDLQQEIATREAELAQLQTDRSASVLRSGRNLNRDALDLDRAHAASELVAARARIDTTTQQIAALDDQIHTLTADDITLEQLARTRSVAEDNYRDMVKVLDDRRVTEAVDENRAANVRLISEASPPIRPNHAMLLLIPAALLFAGIAGVVTALLSDAMRRRFVTAERLQRTLGLPVLVSLSDYA